MAAGFEVINEIAGHSFLGEAEIDTVAKVCEGGDEVGEDKDQAGEPAPGGLVSDLQGKVKQDQEWKVDHQDG